MVVLIGATPEGKKKLLGFQVGVHERAESWRELLVDLRARGLAIAPELAAGGGAAGGLNLREAWNAPDQATAEAAIGTFAEKYGANYEKHARTLPAQRTKAKVAGSVLNRMTRLDMPMAQRIA